LLRSFHVLPYIVYTGSVPQRITEVVHGMSNGTGQHPAGGEATAQADHSVQQAPDPSAKRRVSLKSPQSLERLRDRVQAAVNELDRLRKENAALTERIEHLETRPTLDVDGTLLTFDENPDALREKVEGFINTIDEYLAKETS